MKYYEEITIYVDEGTYLKISEIEKFEDGLSEYAAKLDLRSFGFGLSNYQFYFNDLGGFVSELSNSFIGLSGLIKLGHMFESDFISFDFKKGGHVMVKGIFVRHSNNTQKLEFEFEIDQTYMKSFVDKFNIARNALDKIKLKDLPNKSIHRTAE